MTPDQAFSCGGHGRHIQFFWNVPGIMVMERAADRGIQDPVPVGFLMNIKTGMEPGIDQLCLCDGDILGKEGVDGFQHPVDGNGGDSFKMEHLTQGVDAGICTAGTMDGDRVLKEFGQSVLDASLNGSLLSQSRMLGIL